MDPKDEAKFDQAFLSVLAEINQIEPFFDHIFNFLYRRSDFYRIMRHDRDYMGFRPGQAEEMVTKYFRKYQRWARDADELRAQQGIHEELPAEKDFRPPSEVAAAMMKANDAAAAVTAAAEAPKARFTQLSPEQTAAVAKQVAASRSVPVQVEAYNGGVTENYIWSQTLSDIDIKVPLPKGTKARDLDVEIGLQRLRVALKKPPPKPTTDEGREWPQVLMDGPLFYRVKANESMWSVDGSTVQINLEKSEERMWKCIIEGDKEIDLTKVDTSRHIHDFDQETQSAFERVMYDHRQKMQGKPTIEQQKAYNVLKVAWDAEGSPFKGTPFDPTRVNVHTSSSSGYVPTVYDKS